MKPPTQKQIRAAHVRWLKKFFDEKDMSVKDLCIGLNDWRIKHGLIPVEGTPFFIRGHIAEWKNDKWTGAVRIREERIK